MKLPMQPGWSHRCIRCGVLLRGCLDGEEGLQKIDGSTGDTVAIYSKTEEYCYCCGEGPMCPTCAETHQNATERDLLVVAQGALGYLRALPKESRPDENWFRPLEEAIVKSNMRVGARAKIKSRGTI